MTNSEHRSEQGALSKTVRTILEQAQTMTGATRSYVAFRPSAGGECRVITSSTTPDEFTSTTAELPLESCRLQTRAHSREALESGVEQDDQLWLTPFPASENELARNALFVPFVVDGEVVGLMGLADKAKDFTARDMDMASSFGEYAAMALCDARNADRVNATVNDLRDTIAQQRRGPRIITMCAMCRKFRGDDGSWHVLAPIAGDSVGTNVSHGLCEECARIFFSENVESPEPEAHAPSPPPAAPRFTSTRSR